MVTQLTLKWSCPFLQSLPYLPIMFAARPSSTRKLLPAEYLAASLRPGHRFGIAAVLRAYDELVFAAIRHADPEFERQHPRAPEGTYGFPRTRLRIFSYIGNSQVRFNHGPTLRVTNF